MNLPSSEEEGRFIVFLSVIVTPLEEERPERIGRILVAVVKKLLNTKEEWLQEVAPSLQIFRSRHGDPAMTFPSTSFALKSISLKLADRLVYDYRIGALARLDDFMEAFDAYTPGSHSLSSVDETTDLEAFRRDYTLALFDEMASSEVSSKHVLSMGFLLEDLLEQKPKECFERLKLRKFSLTSFNPLEKAWFSPSMLTKKGLLIIPTRTDHTFRDGFDDSLVATLLSKTDLTTNPFYWRAADTDSIPVEAFSGVQAIFVETTEPSSAAKLINLVAKQKLEELRTSQGNRRSPRNFLLEALNEGVKSWQALNP